MNEIENTDAVEWRSHFHVPVFLEKFESLNSTQSDIKKLLAIHQQKPITSHLEVETYTWEVLPESLKAPIEKSITRELLWVLECLNKNQQ